MLWGPQNIRFPLMTLEWPEEAGSTIEGKERIKLEELEEADVGQRDRDVAAAGETHTRRFRRLTAAHDRRGTNQPPKRRLQ